MEKQTKIKKARRKYDEGFKTKGLRMVNTGRSVLDVACPLFSSAFWAHVPFLLNAARGCRGLIGH